MIARVRRLIGLDRFLDFEFSRPPSSASEKTSL
jgi:hypothetical protein